MLANLGSLLFNCLESWTNLQFRGNRSEKSMWRTR